MKISRYLVAGLIAAALAAGMVSCKGRTLKDVEPTGDTVEVVINTPDTVADSTQTNL